jgi:hypothetical protein
MHIDQVIGFFLLGNERMAYDQKEMGCLDSNWWVLLLPDV